MLSCRGGGKLSRPVYLNPHPFGFQSKIIVLILLTYLSDCEDVSIIYKIQVKIQLVFLSYVLYT